MNCDFQKSGKVHKSGLPYWFCSREGCGLPCVSADGKCSSVCRNTQAVEITAAVVKEAEAKPKAGCKPCERSRQIKAAIAAKMAELKRDKPT